jgi:glycosyltransferase involved in cell wall biosynthesis
MMKPDKPKIRRQRSALRRRKLVREARPGRRGNAAAGGQGREAGYQAGWRDGYRSGRWAAISQNIGKPKVAYVIPGCSISGGVAVVLQHANRLQQRGYDVSLISQDGHTHLDWHPNQVPITSEAGAPQDRDVVIATFWSTTHTARRIPAAQRFYFIQSDESRFYASGSRLSRMALETYKTSDFTFLTMAGWLQRWLQQTFRKKSIYIPNGLDLALMHEAEPLVSRGGRIRVLLEGPIAVPNKGMSEAFAAIKNLDCEVWCVSSAGSPLPSWRCDRFFERVPYEQMKHIYSSCDILLKMSKVESFLFPPLEMMACGGVPVVANVTGTDEYLVHDYNSLIVPNDAGAAAAAVASLIADPALRERLRAGGQATYVNWNWDRSIDLLEAALRGGGGI